MMKKPFLSFSSFLLGLSLMLVSCGGVKTDTAETAASTEENTEQFSDTQSTADTPKPQPEPVSLDGKKIIFVGNSFIYYGQTVLEKKQTVLTQEQRNNDKGYFYQLCKTNGDEVSVTNWTFGGHSLDHLFGGNCSANRGCDGVDHLSYLTDRNYDYVVISEGSGARCNDPFVEQMEKVMKIFREANPDVKFVYLCNAAPYGISSATDKTYRQTNILNHLKVLESQGVIIADWGKLVTDIINGTAAVPNATQEYNQNSFIIRKSAADGYHPNLLTGYITSLMAYCAITGRSATDQSYDFCATTGSSFISFQSKYYTYGNATTNFRDIFASDSDMKGIQQLIDKYLSEKAYLNYNY